MKNKKIVKKLFAGVMAFSLCLGACLGTSAVAVAAPEDNATVVLTKELKIANGIQTPETTFTFNFEQSTTGQYTGADDTKYDVATDAAKINPVNLKFTQGEDNASGTIVKESTNIFADGRYEFPHAGVYKFIVSEVQGAEKIDNGKGEGTMTYDTNRYIMFVSVKNDGNGGLTVDNVIVQPEDPENPGEPGGAKQDAGPGTDENGNAIPEEPSTIEGDDTNVAGTGNDFRFVNTYTKVTGGEDPDPVIPDEPDDPTTSALIVQKNVVGDSADLTQKFDFAITLTVPETAAVETVTAYTVDKDGKVVESDITITSGEKYEFQLAHNEYLGFKSLPAGTTYDVEETGAANYTGAIVTTTNKVESAQINAPAKAENVKVEQAVVGEEVGTNNAIVTNTHDDESTTPTGIIVNNLPYVALIIVAIIGCVVVVASRKRRMS